MRQTYKSRTPQPKEEAGPPVTKAERARGAAYLFFTSTAEWIVIAALVGAIVFVAFGTDTVDSVTEWFGQSR